VNAQPQEDGNLPAARKALDLAIHQLVDPQPQTTPDNTIHWTDSWYMQLQDSIPGQKQQRSGISQSQPPLWTDAIDQLKVIDSRVAEWEPNWPIPLPSLLEFAYAPEPPTVLRLRLINRRCWRPQDTHKIHEHTNTILAWVDRIKDLLNPKPRWHLPNPCPSCGTATVYRRDSGGENVRQPALQIGEHGCTCGSCGQIWQPEYFAHLARVLGYQLENGILE